MPERQPVHLELRAFGIDDVPRFAPSVLDLGLLHLVEGVVPGCQRVVQALHVAGGVQGAPGLDAGAAFARL